MVTLSDEEAVRRIRGGETALFEVLMRRYNQRIYRLIRAILKDDSEAEDVMQQAYLNAYRHLDQFAERSKVSTWLTKIAMYEAFGRVRKRHPTMSLDEPDTEGLTMMDTLKSRRPDPEQALLARETSGLLEAAVTALPENFRTVFMLRDVEGLSTGETAESLGLTEETVKTRLHRARRQLRQQLADRLGASVETAFPFPATRCNRVVEHVMAMLLRPESQREITPK